MSEISFVFSEIFLYNTKVDFYQLSRHFWTLVKKQKLLRIQFYIIVVIVQNCFQIFIMTHPIGELPTLMLFHHDIHLLISLLHIVLLIFCQIWVGDIKKYSQTQPGYRCFGWAWQSSIGVVAESICGWVGEINNKAKRSPTRAVAWLYFTIYYWIFTFPGWLRSLYGGLVGGGNQQ